LLSLVATTGTPGLSPFFGMAVLQVGHRFHSCVYVFCVCLSSRECGFAGWDSRGICPLYFVYVCHYVSVIVLAGTLRASPFCMLEWLSWRLAFVSIAVGVLVCCNALLCVAEC